jgi:peptidase M28-like protein
LPTITKTLLAAFALAGALLAQSSKPEDSITPEGLRAHVRFLSDDLLEGRGTATRGHAIATKYVAAQFEGMNLKPAGDDGTYFQTVHLRQAFLQSDKSSFSIVTNGQEQPLQFSKEWYSGGDFLRTDTSAEGQVVFVGFGLTAPEMQHDDYAGVDVKGKIVAYFPGAPAKWESTVQAYYSSTYLKAKTAAEHGAIGLIGMWSPDLEKRFSWERALRNFRFGVYKIVSQDGLPNDTYPEIHGGAVVPLAVARQWMTQANHDLDTVFSDAGQGKLQSFEFPFSAKIHLVTQHKDQTSPNVAAVLPGSDPKLKDEYVVYSAHLDHLGISEPLNGDTINNGAYDNASGSAALIEIARAFSRMPKAPKRSLVFLNVTAEEKGLLGAYYYSLNPTVAKKDIVANINMDELASLFPLADVIGLGADHSTLDEDVKFAARQEGFETSPDPFPSENDFIRSDQFPFVRQGVPAFALEPGMKSSDPKVDGKAIYMDWLEHIYHTQRDEITLPFDWPSNARLARMEFLIGQRVGNAAQRPMWKKGDFFQQKFGGPVEK